MAPLESAQGQQQASGLGAQAFPNLPPPAPVQIYYTPPKPMEAERNLYGAYLLWLPPFGLLGFHHLYLKRPFWFVFYLLTFGGFGMGWMMDMCRMPTLLRRYHVGDNRKRLDDAYILWLPPFGLLGAHQFYLKRPGFGLLYFLTFGCFGIGWLLDMCFIPWLLGKANEAIDQNAASAQQHAQQAAQASLPAQGYPGYGAVAPSYNGYGQPVVVHTYQPGGYQPPHVNQYYPAQPSPYQAPPPGLHQAPPPGPPSYQPVPPPQETANAPPPYQDYK